MWEDAKAARCTADCRMCTVYIEVCTRAGSATAALDMYKEMATAPAGSKLAPSVHTYTAAMRAAAAEGGTWHEALTIWDDMLAAGCTPTGALLSLYCCCCCCCCRRLSLQFAQQYVQGHCCSKSAHRILQYRSAGKPSTLMRELQYAPTQHVRLQQFR